MSLTGDTPLISVVVCTYNRASLLEGAITSLAQQTLDRSQYEILVVDNNSTDETPETVRRIQESHSDATIRYLTETRQGLGYARNTGVEHSRADYVAFLDDDAQAPPGYLARAVGLFEEVQPTPWVVGGPIHPYYPTPKPSWFRDAYEIRTWGSASRFLAPGEWFSGSNMVFRAGLISDYGGFATDKGMAGGVLSVGEETALFERMWQSPQRPLLYYCPDLIVHHAVPKAKMRPGYHLRRHFAHGNGCDESPRSDLAARCQCLLGDCIAGAKCGWYVLRLLPGIRHPSQFVVECLGPLAYELGRLARHLGIRHKVRQR